MADQPPNVRSGFFAGDQSAQNIRRTFIEAPLEAAQQPTLGSLLELAGLFSALPGAFMASQRRELERVTESHGKDDPRISFLQASIERADVLRATVQLGQARSRRMLVALGGNQYIFHGFVSDTKFAPLKGLTVRLIGTGQATGVQTLTAITEDDGYFRIPLGAKGEQASTSQWINSLLTGSSPDSPPAGTEAKGEVEIASGDKVVYRDPASVPLGQGSVYREYVISPDEVSAKT